MNILFTVCGRAGSKGIKNKNFREFLGNPLLFYTFAAIEAYKKQHIDELIDVALNTDSPEMIRLVRGRLVQSVLLVDRKPELAGDTAAKIPVIADTLEEAERQTRRKYEMVVDFDITSPLRTVQDIERLVAKKQNEDWDVVFSVTEARRNPYFNMVKLEADGRAALVNPSNYTARQQAPKIYDMNASLYAYSPDFLRSGKDMFEGRCGIIEMMDTGILDLDREHDFELMQVVAKYLFSKRSEYKLFISNWDKLLGESDRCVRPINREE